MGITLFERELRTLGFVPRWVITRNIKTQSVAEHSFYVAIYAGQIAGFMGRGREEIGEILHAALWHDVEECFTGDIPGPAKRDMACQAPSHKDWLLAEIERRFPGQVCNISDDIRRILKVANLLDEVFYKATEINMGNKGAIHSCSLSHNRLYAAVKDLLSSDNTISEIWYDIQKAIEQHKHGVDILPENDNDLAPRY